ncbi:Uncharacterised protein [Escherichia coli]|nr:Uncharacterised protein [Escherichia coli]CAD6086058.1 Uncharacterised protein [Escherichia coli]CAD6149173.1 Uncharacterised protein [Escherichia coli]
MVSFKTIMEIIHSPSTTHSAEEWRNDGTATSTIDDAGRTVATGKSYILKSWRMPIRESASNFPQHGHVAKKGFFGIDDLRIFLPTEAFEHRSEN